jgi:hypothetical protein
MAYARAKTADPQPFLRSALTSPPIKLTSNSFQPTLWYLPFIWVYCLDHLLPIQKTYKNPVLMADSTQDDTHDKAWEKAEKKFAQYVLMFLHCLDPLVFDCREM